MRDAASMWSAVGVLTLLLLLPGSATGAAVQSPPPKLPRSVLVGYASPTEVNATLHAVTQGMQAEILRSGARFKVFDASFNYDAMNGHIRQLINQGAKAIATCCVPASLLRSSLRDAEKAGIPTFGHDSVNRYPALPSEFAPIKFNVLQGRTRMAQQSMKYLAARLNGDVQILGVGICFKTPTIDEQFKQARLALRAYPRMKFADTVCNKTDNAAGALPVVQDALQRNPEINAVFAYNDPSAIGAARAADLLGRRDDVVIIGYNAASDGVSGVRSGLIDVTFDYKPVEIGQTLARGMELYLLNRRLPATVTVQPVMYTRANIRKFVPWSTRVKQVRAGRYLGVPLG